MIQQESVVAVIDNSGAKTALVIRVLGSKATAGVGDLVVVTVKTATTQQGGIKKGTISRAVVVRTKKPVRRADGSTVGFDGNAVVLVNESGEQRGTRVLGPVAHEVKKDYPQIASRAAELA